MDALAWLVVGGTVCAYGVLGFVVELFRPAIDRAGKSKQEEL
jgi:hypothetical protein